MGAANVNGWGSCRRYGFWSFLGLEDGELDGTCGFLCVFLRSVLVGHCRMGVVVKCVGVFAARYASCVFMHIHAAACRETDIACFRLAANKQTRATEFE